MRKIIIMAMLTACSGSDDGSDSGGSPTSIGSSVGSMPAETSAEESTGAGETSPAETSAADTSSDDGASCEADANEPNDIEQDAIWQPTITDCDEDAGAIDGILDWDGDVDWYAYRGNDTFGCVVDPLRSVVATDYLRFCKFVECVDGSNASAGPCPVGTAAAATDSGMPGCCAEGVGVVDFAVPVDCASGDDSTSVYVRLDQSPVDACVAYTVSYHY